jgi:hypothetical protein
MARAFWQHKTSGGVYAVELDEDGAAREAVGPIYYANITQSDLDTLDFNAVTSAQDSSADADWLNGEPCKIVEPSDYYVAE